MATPDRPATLRAACVGTSLHTRTAIVAAVRAGLSAGHRPDGADDCFRDRVADDVADAIDMFLEEPVH